MKRACTLFLTAAVAFALPPAPPAIDPAERLLPIVHEADAVRIQFHVSTGKDEVTFTDAFWLEKLAAVLAFASYKPQEHCFCVSYPTIRLMRKNEVIATFSVHHNAKLRAYAGSVSGDFLVGEKTGHAILALAMEKKGLTRR